MLKPNANLFERPSIDEIDCIHKAEFAHCGPYTPILAKTIKNTLSKIPFSDPILKSI